MRSVADDLRRRTRDQVLAMTPAARVALALSLGDADLEMFVRSTGRPRDEARRQLRARRARGRAPSVAALAPAP